MSRSDSKRKLRVSSEDSGVQITVLNQMLEPVAWGVQKVEVELAPGLYEARFAAGSSVRERLVALKSGPDPEVIHQEPIAFASAAPLLHTRTVVPEQSNAAARLSRQIHRRLGRGGRLLVFVRDRDLRARTSLAHGLALLGADGEVGSIEADGERGGGPDREHPPWAACSYELAAGSWRLRCAAPHVGAVEQTVVVCHAWQTQVFLERRRSHSGRARLPELSDASVLMAKTRDGFEPDLTEMRAAELARQSLRDGRAAVPASDLRAMVYGKRRNPMLAIYGAHLMIREAEPDRQFVRRVTNNLRRLVGDHPDVRALTLWHSPDEDVGDFADPPMLMSSWAILMKAARRRPDLIPDGSLSASIDRRVIAAGPWLRWRAL